MAKRGRKKKTWTVKNRFKLGIAMVLASFFYFFAYFMAPGSLFHNIFNYPTRFLFGNIGNKIFFGLLIFLGVIIMLNRKILYKGIFKKTTIIFVNISAVLNFPILENTTSIDSIVDLGGRLGYTPLFIGDILFDSRIEAIKWFYIITLIGLVVWIAFSFDIKFPKLKLPTISLPTLSLPSFELPSIPTTSSNKNISISSKTSNAKSNSSSNTTSSSSKSKTKSQSKIKDSDEPNKDIVKKILKDRISSKMKKKTSSLEQLQIDFPEQKPTFDLNILTKSEYEGEYDIDDDYLAQKASDLEKKLQEFNISVTVQGFNIGPTVIQIKLKPDAGIKVSKIERVKKDLSLALRAESLRILAPIPGTSHVGIEIPNPKARIVRLKELLGSKILKKEMKDNFTNLAVGKSVDGSNIVKSLEEMPHLLIAGATGSGKSVGVNDFITSLLYQNTPRELRLIMVDPKQVELSMYEGLPYLLSPIITEPGKALKVLKWAGQHMDERYNMLKNKKARNIVEYNKKVSKKEKMYRIVVVIDELADLMMTGNKKDTEKAIARIAQKARAVGIHLIVATQRPSVNVITGLIKANIPTRIAFSVVSGVDSRTILGFNGAEDLLGNGDLLYKDTNTKQPIRVQSPLVTTYETETIVDDLKKKYMQNIDNKEDIYHPEIMNILEDNPETVSMVDLSSDDQEKIKEAVKIIASTNKASATMLQRKLSIGFPRASRLLDVLEKKGVVGPQKGTKPREVLI